MTRASPVLMKVPRRCSCSRVCSRKVTRSGRNASERRISAAPTQATQARAAAHAATRRPAGARAREDGERRRVGDDAPAEEFRVAGAHRPEEPGAREAKRAGLQEGPDSEPNREGSEGGDRPPVEGGGEEDGPRRPEDHGAQAGHGKRPAGVHDERPEPSPGALRIDRIQRREVDPGQPAHGNERGARRAEKGDPARASPLGERDNGGGRGEAGGREEPRRHAGEHQGRNRDRSPGPGRPWGKSRGPARAR
jgi:hypothetical protein